MVYFIISFLVCLFSSALLKRLLPKSRLSVAKERPMLLGPAIYLSVLATLIFASAHYRADYLFAAKLLVGCSLILLLGIADDLKNLSANSKLLGQLVIACAAVFLGIRTTIYYFPLWLNAMLTIVWMVALINAFNLLDIMDGLCTGVSLIASASFLLISMVSGGEGFISIFFWVLSGATMAALIYNLPPAKLYLGDSGSMLLGFIFACCALKVSYAPHFSQGLSLFAPVLIVALPLYDLVFTVLMRMKKGLPVGQKSRDHLAFILKGLGLEHKRILSLIYGVCIIFGASAVLLKLFPASLKIWLLAILGSALALSALLMNAIESKQARQQR